MTVFKKIRLMIEKSHDRNMVVQNNFFSRFQSSTEHTFKKNTSIISGQTSVDVILIQAHQNLSENEKKPQS